MIVIRTYIQTLPERLIESAKVDGAGDFRTFVSIILPLCHPVLATVALFIAVGQWNSWFDTFLYRVVEAKLEHAAVRADEAAVLRDVLEQQRRP